MPLWSHLKNALFGMLYEIDMKITFTLLNLICLTLAAFFMAESSYRWLFNRLDIPFVSHLPYTTEDLGSVGTTEPLSLPLSPHGQKPSSQQNRVTKKGGDASFPLTHYDLIKQRNLFNCAVDSGEEIENDARKITEAEIANLEKTDLDITLWGTVKGWDTENYAVIEDGKTRDQGLYKQGDTIEGTDAVIKKVLRMSVVLTRNGKDQILMMADEMKAVQGQASSLSAHSDQSTIDKSSKDAVEIRLERSEIDEAMGDINGLMKQARIRPHFTGGKADGLLIYGVKQSSIFKTMGIRNGDILVGVDGREIHSVEDAISLYDKLKNASEAKIEIKRRGKTKELIYHVE